MIERSQQSEVRMNETAKTFEDLLVWQKAHEFVLEVYKITGSFPRHEIYGLSSQFRRAAVSIAANIAEGFRKRSKADKGRFYNIAQGSIEECRYYIILSKDLGYCRILELNEKIQEVSRLLEGYTNKILNTGF